MTGSTLNKSEALVLGTLEKKLTKSEEDYKVRNRPPYPGVSMTPREIAMSIRDITIPETYRALVSLSQKGYVTIYRVNTWSKKTGKRDKFQLFVTRPEDVKLYGMGGGWIPELPKEDSLISRAIELRSLDYSEG
jgi:hypothetical protein